MAWYRAGTATFTNGSKNVTGAGTAWATNVRPGDEIIGPDNISREVETVTSDTALVMVETYTGSTAVGASYKFKPIQGWNRDVASRLAALIADYGSIEAALAVVAGRVGVGTLTPVQPLSVATTGDAVAAAFGESGSSTGKVVEVGYFAAADHGRIQSVHQGTGYKTLALNPSGGFVGIGTSAPQVNLEVQGASTALRVNGLSGTPATLQLSSAGVAQWSLSANQGAAGEFGLAYSSTRHLTVASSGNVGIGTTSPAALLHVNGTVRLDVAVTSINAGPGGSAALPAAPAGYAFINIGGVERRIPYYP